MPKGNHILFQQPRSKLISGDQAERAEDAQIMLPWAGLWLALRPQSRLVLLVDVCETQHCVLVAYCSVSFMH